MPTEEILVLASSKKHGGRCVAGITRSGDWVRPVSGGSHGLFEAQCSVDGRWPEVLDVIRFGYSKQLEDPAQPENFLIDTSEWELSKRLDPTEARENLRGFLSSGPTLLGNRGRAVKDEIAAEGVEASLALIEPRSGVKLILSPPEDGKGKPKTRVAFNFSAAEYDLPVTDIAVEEALRAAGEGSYDPEDLGLVSGTTFLTISLGEEFEGWHYKLAAAVIFLP